MSTPDRLLDLLVARATEGLNLAESRELDALLAAQDEFEFDDLDLAAAQADIGFQAVAGDNEPLPEMLRARVLAAAAARVSPPARPTPAVLDWRNWGWVAAAAIILLALWAPWSRETAPSTTPAVLSLAEQRSALITGASDVIQVAWAPSAVEGYAAVQGDVVWSPSRQAGFMRFRGLPANRTDAEQYQLWIVDPTRDTQPIDGGVFDISAEAREVIVPIDAKLAVSDARAFAITLEKPGGVVVSDGPLLVVAPVGA